MKLYFAYFIIFVWSGLLKAQSVFNAELIYKLETARENEFIQVLMLTKADLTVAECRAKNITIHYQVGNIYSVTLPLQSLKQLKHHQNIIRVEYTAKDLKLMGDTCLVRNRIKAIHAGNSPLSQAYDGQGVLVGIIDSGTDFNHPDLKDENGKSRINYLWDMSKPLASNTPTAFGYGQEWTNTEIDNGLCTHDDLPRFGHGTNSAGIAAGNGYAINHYEGMAPKANLMVVALDFSKSGNIIADAVNYLVRKADELAMPLVINASVGGYYGSHDGTDLETKLITNLIANKPGKCLVASAGNAGSIPFHVGYDIVPTDTNFTWISSNSSIFGFTEYADTNQIKNVKFSVGVNNPAFHNLGTMTFKNYDYCLNEIKRDTIFNNAKRIGIIETTASINTDGVYELLVMIRADSLNYLWRMEHTGTGRIDSWNFSYKTSGLPSISQYPKMAFYKKADTLQTIVSGFQCSSEIITVGNYVNRNKYIDVNGNLQITNEIAGQIAASSSNGPSRRGLVKPDITASGASILAATAIGLLPNFTTNAPQIVAQGGYHVTAGGTSASSPVVAGFAALYLQKNPTATNQQIKQAIIDCAYKDVYTTNSLPNSRWGYGKLDGFCALTIGVVPSSVNELNELQMNVYPNPVINETTVYFTNQSTKTLKLFDLSGQLIFTDVTNLTSYVLKKQQLSSGIYFLEVTDNSKFKRIKLVIL